jgi:fumarate reductase subunit D
MSAGKSLLVGASYASPRYLWEGTEMIVLTAAALGISAGQMRSAGVIALVAALIGMTFALAAISSPGPVSILAFVYAVLGYNGGLVLFLLGLYANARLRRAMRLAR